MYDTAMDAGAGSPPPDATRLCAIAELQRISSDKSRRIQAITGQVKMLALHAVELIGRNLYERT